MARSKRSVEKEAFWRLVLNEHAASWLSIKAFCKRETVSEASFYFWRRELEIRDEQSGQTPNSPAIIPVRVVDSESNNSHADLTDGDQRPVSSGVVEVTVPGVYFTGRRGDGRPARYRLAPGPFACGRLMVSIASSTRIFVATSPTDMRKGFDGLQVLVAGRGRCHRNTSTAKQHTRTVGH